MNDKIGRVLFLIFFISLSQGEEHEINNEIKFTLIVDGEDGSNCTNLSPLGRTQIASALWTIERINKLKALGEVQMDLKIFDSCSNYLQVYLENYLKRIDNEENDSLEIPLIVTSDAHKKLENLSEWLQQPTYSIQKKLESSFDLVQIMLNFIIKMNFDDKMILIVNDLEVKDTFLALAQNFSICIDKYYDEKIFSREIDEFMGSSASIILYLGDGKSFNRISHSVRGRGQNKTWIVLLDDGDVVTEDFPEKTYLILPSYADYYQTQKIYNKLTTSLILFNVASPILKLLNLLQETSTLHCNETQTFQCLRSNVNFNVPEINKQLDKNKILDILQIKQLSSKFNWNVYEIRPEENDVATNDTEEDFYININGKMKKVISFNVFNTIELNDLISEDWKNRTKCEIRELESTTELTTEDTQLKFVVTIVSIRWRGEAWTAALISLTTIGVCVAFSVLIFFLIRICKGDILEGNPTGSIILVITIIVLYLSVIPFCLKLDKARLVSQNHEEFKQLLQGNFGRLSQKFYLSNDLSLLKEPGFKLILWDFNDGLEHVPCLVCTVTYFVISLSFTVAFALMLSRAIMIASIGYDDAGFTRISHVCGFIQATLFFFIALVQVGLNFELIWSRKIGSCEEILSGNYLIYLLGYNGFLLVILFCVSPLIIRSQRNYNEGMMFSVAIYLLAILWFGWISIFILTSITVAWKVLVIAFSTVATATIILCTVFVPRTYRIVTGLARDNLASSLQALNNYNSTNHLGFVDHQHHSYTFYDTVHVDKLNMAKSGGYIREEQFIPEPPLEISHHATAYTNRNFQPDELCSRKIADKHFNDDYEWCADADDDNDDQKSIDSDKITRF